MTTPLPQPLDQLRHALEGRGFWIADESYREDRFGDLLLLLVRRQLAVRILRDRGQWSVEASSSGDEQWYSPMVWRSYLDSELGDLATPSLEDQCQLLLTSLDAMGAAANRDPRLAEQLQAWRSRRANARQGGRPQSE